MKDKIKLILAVLLGWFIPGLGYLVIGKKYKALVLLCSIVSLAVAGIILADFRDVRFIDNPYYYVGRFGSGLVWGVTILFLHPAPIGVVPFQYFDIGHLYLCVAGTLNLVLALSVFSQFLYSQVSSPVMPEADPCPPAGAAPVAEKSVTTDVGKTVEST